MAIRISKTLILLISPALFVVPEGLDSCSIGPPTPIFSTKTRMANPDRELSQRKLGAVLASYKLPYLIGAYRVLNGGTSTVPTSPPDPAVDYSKTPVKTWLDARTAVPGIKPIDFYNGDREKSTNGSVVYYPNCLDAAFITAASTLEKRTQTWGRNSAKLRDWVTAQDIVFSNCSGHDVKLPSALPNDPDRAYQIAAANFYAGQWQIARTQFDQIAKDKSSPWRDLAPYLTARTYIREAQLENKPDLLRQAEKILKTIPTPAARGLLDYTQIRLDPFAKMGELAKALTGPNPVDPQKLADYIYLYRRNTDPLPPNFTPRHDLTDWVLTLRNLTPESSQHAKDQFEKTRKPHWLIAALANKAPGLLQAARAVKPGVPEYESAAYYGIALQTAADRNDARKWADEALAASPNPSTRNLLLAERQILARNYPEFLHFAPRIPEPKLVNFDDHEDEAEKPISQTPVLDEDTIGALNYRLPLALWLEAAASPELSATARNQIAEAGWVRAFILNRPNDARKFLPKADPSPFPAALAALKAPAFSPIIEPGDASIVDYRLNMGASFWIIAEQAEAPQPPAFLTPTQNAQANAEWAQMRKTAPNGINYLAGIVIPYAKTHADDPQVPEALHRVVKATQISAMKDDNTGSFSKQAFDLLHQRYPKSDWAKKTPYWYK